LAEQTDSPQKTAGRSLITRIHILNSFEDRFAYMKSQGVEDVYKKTRNRY